MRVFWVTLLAASTLGAASAQAQWISRWDRIGGGWSSGWQMSSRPECLHREPACRGPDGDFCGWHSNGSVALWWRNGPKARPWRIICAVRRG